MRIRRPLLVFVCLAVAAGCSSLLGDFDVGPDGSDSGVSPGVDSGQDAGSRSDSGVDGGTDAPAAACEAGTPATCLGNVPQACVGGQWVAQTPCGADDVNYVCTQGTCTGAPSCATLISPNCGASPATANCCKSPVVTGATFNRNFAPANQTTTLPATVSSYRLDEFEVTVVRFRTFLQAGKGVAGSPPAAGSGANPHLANSGWLTTFNAQLQADRATLETALTSCGGLQGAQYSALPNTNDTQPMNCANWFEAFAFCIWDGGRLPTAAEFNLAQVAGTEQRKYPWGAAALDATRASFCPNPGTASNPMPCLYTAGIIAAVGSKPLGAGKFGQLDLIGSTREFVLDFIVPIPNPCIDCAQLSNLNTSLHGAMGWSWSDTAIIIDTYGLTGSTNTRTSAGGFRCARDL